MFFTHLYGEYDINHTCISDVTQPLVVGKHQDISDVRAEEQKEKIYH
jgi:hypothetical protein